MLPMHNNNTLSFSKVMVVFIKNLKTVIRSIIINQLKIFHHEACEISSTD